VNDAELYATAKIWQVDKPSAAIAELRPSNSGSFQSEADYHLEVDVPDLEHYQQFLLGKLLAMPIVRDVRSSKIAIQTLKANGAFPLQRLEAAHGD
jgi:DNA-binding Lrp family transcriptional regulator